MSRYIVWSLLLRRSILHAGGQLFLHISVLYNSISITNTFYNLGPVVVFFFEAYIYQVSMQLPRNPSAEATCF